eukprot:NODE_2487_length_1106_cov_8.708609_g2066_i0.p1 GENE.NODE_2487_length_1106_cov_8.708609_g2066_i0~~NODE_2487_length_1106_cov_8.708609_g2066_i0.p1  ORF type:complete len:345 (+),score=31.00 NODE_2487_length_1106_cov_8.708609_g2066_i0:51-1037(+)
MPVAMPTQPFNPCAQGMHNCVPPTVCTVNPLTVLGFECAGAGPSAPAPWPPSYVQGPPMSVSVNTPINQFQPYPFLNGFSQATQLPMSSLFWLGFRSGSTILSLRVVVPTGLAPGNSSNLTTTLTPEQQQIIDQKLGLVKAYTEELKLNLEETPAARKFAMQFRINSGITEDVLAASFEMSVSPPIAPRTPAPESSPVITSEDTRLWVLIPVSAGGIIFVLGVVVGTGLGLWCCSRRPAQDGPHVNRWIWSTGNLQSPSPSPKPPPVTLSAGQELLDLVPVPPPPFHSGASTELPSALSLGFATFSPGRLSPTPTPSKTLPSDHVAES